MSMLGLFGQGRQRDLLQDSPNSLAPPPASSIANSSSDDWPSGGVQPHNSGGQIAGERHIYICSVRPQTSHHTRTSQRSCLAALQWLA
jgi:hypothetical protein